MRTNDTVWLLYNNHVIVDRHPFFANFRAFPPYSPYYSSLQSSFIVDATNADLLPEWPVMPGLFCCACPTMLLSCT